MRGSMAEVLLDPSSSNINNLVDANNITGGMFLICGVKIKTI